VTEVKSIVPSVYASSLLYLTTLSQAQKLELRIVFVDEFGWMKKDKFVGYFSGNGRPTGREKN
jgi:hypothetical protein